MVGPWFSGSEQYSRTHSLPGIPSVRSPSSVSIFRQNMNRRHSVLLFRYLVYVRTSRIPQLSQVHEQSLHPLIAPQCMHIWRIRVVHSFLPSPFVCTTLASRPTCHAQKRLGSSTTSGRLPHSGSGLGIQAGLLLELKMALGYTALQSMQRMRASLGIGLARYVLIAVWEHFDNVASLGRGGEGTA